MRRLIILGAVGAAFGLLTGCGGGGGASGAPGGGGTKLTWEQRLAVMEQVRQRFESVAGTGDLDSQNQVLLAYAQSLLGVKEATLAERCITVSFADGSPFVVINNREPAAAATDGRRARRSSAPASSRAYGPELAGSRLAVLLNTVGTGYDAADADLAPLLRQQQYDAREVNPTLDDLTRLKGAGVVYYSTHGGLMWRKSDNLRSYCLWTASPVGSLDQLRQQWLDAGLIVPVEATREVRPDGTKIVALQWAVTQRFISAYWADLSANCLVFLDACGSDHALMTAELQKVASVFLTWTGFTNDGDPARFLFDRLLGTNAVAPTEAPPQRPFDVASVWQDMKNRGLTHSTAGGDLRRHDGTPGEFGLLAPAITHMYTVEEDEELVIAGTFGTDPGDRSVTVGGVAQPVKEWKPYVVRVFLPKSGAGSAGDVIVTSRGRTSNVVQLTEWRGRLMYRFVGPGSLLQAANLDVHLRADVHDLRDAPGAAPHANAGGMITAAPDSGAAYESSGTYTVQGDGESHTVSWSGAASIPWWNNKGTAPATYWQLLGNIDPAAHKIQIGLIARAANGLTVTSKHVDRQGHTTTDSATTDFGLMDLYSPNAYVTLTLDSNWNIVAGGVSSPPTPFGVITGAETVVARLDWGNIAARFPPRPDSARSARVTRR